MTEEKRMAMDELYHYGVLGMKWGVRRYQPYGEGGYNPKKLAKQYKKRLNKLDRNMSYLSKNIAGYKHAQSEAGQFNIKPSKKREKQLNDYDKKIDYLKDEYKKSAHEMTKQLKEIEDNKDLLWSNISIDRTFVTAGKDFKNDFKKQFGKKTLSEVFDTEYYQYTTGNHFDVKLNTEKRRGKYKWAKTKRIYVHTPVHEETHVMYM